MFAKNYRRRSLFEKVMEKIKRCSFLPHSVEQSSPADHKYSIMNILQLSIVTLPLKVSPLNADKKHDTPKGHAIWLLKC